MLINFGAPVLGPRCVLDLFRRLWLPRHSDSFSLSDRIAKTLQLLAGQIALTRFLVEALDAVRRVLGVPR